MSINLLNKYVWLVDTIYKNKYIDRWDWNKLVNRYFDDDLYSMDFYLRYQKYIPFEILEGSLLWEAIVTDERDAIEKELIFGK